MHISLIYFLSFSSRSVQIIFLTDYHFDQVWIGCAKQDNRFDAIYRILQNKHRLNQNYKRWKAPARLSYNSYKKCMEYQYFLP